MKATIRWRSSQSVGYEVIDCEYHDSLRILVQECQKKVKDQRGEIALVTEVQVKGLTE